MQKIRTVFQRGSGMSPYIWSILSLLPFYFIFQSSSTIEIFVGIGLTVLFFIALRLAFMSKKWPVYLWMGTLIAISLTMTILVQYVYFAFYIAYYNGHIRNRAAFITLYVIHLISTTIAINYHLVLQSGLILEQLPFVIIVFI